MTHGTKLFALAVWCGLVVASAAADRPANIILMYADNLGYGDLGCYGNAGVKTPRIDRLAQEGVRCTQFYVVAPTCTASRGAILTGRYPLRNGLSHQLVTTENWHGIGLPHRERIVPQYLQPAGYATACIGKWNIGFAPGSRPTERGFDEFFGCRSGNIHYFKHTYHGRVRPLSRHGAASRRRLQHRTLRRRSLRFCPSPVRPAVLPVSAVQRPALRRRTERRTRREIRMASARKILGEIRSHGR